MDAQQLGCGWHGGRGNRPGGRTSRSARRFGAGDRRIDAVQQFEAYALYRVDACARSALLRIPKDAAQIPCRLYIVLWVVRAEQAGCERRWVAVLDCVVLEKVRRIDDAFHLLANGLGRKLQCPAAGSATDAPTRAFGKEVAPDANLFAGRVGIGRVELDFGYQKLLAIEDHYGAEGARAGRVQTEDELLAVRRIAVGAAALEECELPRGSLIGVQVKDDGRVAAEVCGGGEVGARGWG